MHKDDIIQESTATSQQTNSNIDMSKYGKLEDPRAAKPVKSSEEYADDGAGFSLNESHTPKHKSDPRYIDITKEEKRIKKWALDNGKLQALDEKNKYLDTPLDNTAKDGLRRLHSDMAKQFGDSVVEIADGSFRVRQIRTDLSNPVAEFADVGTGTYNAKGMMLETAEDDRVIGIPYSIANIGAEKYYIINGRVYSAWAMWFGLQAIRSPEDYQRNVDLTYNIPFVWAGFQLKSQLSLGASFDVVHGTEEEVTPEEDFLNEIFNSKLNIGVNKLAKTSFHLDMYGNAYWHIRRDNRGIPDKITILQPERMKVFLDPKTTKVIYYIYLPPILAGMALTPYPNIRENPNIMWGPSLTYPIPIVIDPQDIIHFKENDFTEYPYGLSSCKAMLDPATARMDINVIAPMIFKRYAKPFIHWKLDPLQPFQLTKGQIEAYISGMKSTLENLEPMSDPITSTRWSANPVGAAQGKAELLTILQDLDNQIFACIGVSESYFKPQMGTDRMLAEQDKTLLAAMQQRQRMVGDNIQSRLVKPIINTYDRFLNEQLEETGGVPMPPRKWNEYPTLQWRETFKQDQISTIQNTLALLQANIIDHARAARRVGEAPPQESAELSLQQDLMKITAQVQVEQAKMNYMQAQLGQQDAQFLMANGGTMAVQQAQAEAAAQAAGPVGGGGGSKAPSKGGEKKGSAPEGKKKVTFTNRMGKRQAEIMNDSTLQDRKSSGATIEKVEPA